MIGKWLINDMMEYQADTKIAVYEELVITWENADVIK